tara:strand:+ start:781 stop:966 length:186 start_codon:yes stop_codon:yes gene_type:complete
VIVRPAVTSTPDVETVDYRHIGWLALHSRLHGSGSGAPDFSQCRNELLAGSDWSVNISVTM